MLGALRLRARSGRHVARGTAICHGSADAASPNRDSPRAHAIAAHGRARHIGANVNASPYSHVYAVADTLGCANDACRCDPNSARRICNGRTHCHPRRDFVRHIGRAYWLAGAGHRCCPAFDLRLRCFAGDHRCPQTDLPQ